MKQALSFLKIVSVSFVNSVRLSSFIFNVQMKFHSKMRYSPQEKYEVNDFSHGNKTH